MAVDKEVEGLPELPCADANALALIAARLRNMAGRVGSPSHAGDVMREIAAEADALAASGVRLRPEVLTFAVLMEEQLRANDHKPGWKGDFASDLFPRVLEEAEELRGAITIHGAQVMWGDMALYLPEAIARVGREAADVANFAMMIADVCGALSPLEASVSTPSQMGGN